MGCFSSAPSQPQAPSVIRVNKPDPGPLSFKVVMIGNMGVGKSSLVLRYTKGEFFEGLEPTIGAAFSSEALRLPIADRATGETKEREVKLNIWDTAGEEMYRSMTKSFFRNAAAAILVFDLTDLRTFSSLQSWVDDFREHCPDALVFVVGNKADVTDRRAVSRAEAEAFQKAARLHGYEECSAKTQLRVKELFNTVAQTLAER